MSYFANRTEAESGAPLVLTFHGTGGDEYQFHGLGSELVPGAHVVSPRGDVDEGGHARFFRRTGEGVYDMEDLSRRTDTMAQFIFAEKLRTSPSRVIGLGYSNGANILASLSFRHADLVDDLVLMHPLIPFDPDPQPLLAGHRVLITAGRRDPICPPDLTETLSAYYAAHGAAVTTHWHDGGHEVARSELEAAQAFLSE
ncbi:alpha/beta hydrolase [Tranquillimonas alkanivorans]|uniref:Phospholipase/carboxylesterase n=1 Tax=Tranquillimonas alkanivorans TaxID=441119 RepID=A0A1I5L0M4_9RHOB|nr:alpha/beta hydrolase [Tranquillimonas alkanivorans]SFO90672.1 phospholipase/carboxylesterase [Tranquillimonas alkanivorans]